MFLRDVWYDWWCYVRAIISLSVRTENIEPKHLKLLLDYTLLHHLTSSNHNTPINKAFNRSQFKMGQGKITVQHDSWEC
jgi:hypothetical protein